MAKPLLTSMLVFLIGMSLLLPELSTAEDSGVMYSGQAAVLMYHHVHDTDQSSSTITTKLFEEQLVFLLNKGYHFISLDEFRDYMEGGALPPNAVLVTFDDGYESFYTNAYPVLKKLKIPAVNFIITDTLDEPKAGYLHYLSREQIQTMTAESPALIDMQCHTHGMHKIADGPFLTTKLEVDGMMETEAQYRQRIARDTGECIRQLSPLGLKPIEYMAYPYGAFNETAQEMVKQAGIRYAFTIVPKMATTKSGPLAIPRINAGNPSIEPQELHLTILRRIQLSRSERNLPG